MWLADRNPASEPHRLQRANVAAVTDRVGAAIRLAVVGAHLSGQPLNHQLTDLGGALVETTRTAACYRFYALDTVPPKPGLVRVAAGQGASIEAEVWALDAAAFGTFVDAVPAPLVIGRVHLEDGADVAGFLCEPIAIGTAVEITALGGWRAYLARGAG